MLVFGDSVRARSPMEMLGGLESRLRPAAPGHAELVSAFVLASELVQGILDAEFAAKSADIDTPARRSSGRLLMALAKAVRWSWQGQGSAEPRADVAAAIAELRDQDLPASISCKTAEGFAYYAVYPESYSEAAAELRGRGPCRVIGIRSIGTGLSAMVAEAIGTEPPILLRPIGTMSQRRLALDASIAAALLADRTGTFATVDEGPGLSGGSFGCVADYLERNGIEREQICFFPSHPGDLGSMASESHRARWRTARRHLVTFERFVDRRDGKSLSDWTVDLAGAALAPLDELSAGRWRAHRFAREEDWPAANIMQERRKYLLRSASGVFLLKFAGLGHYGTGKLKLAEALSRGGFTPEFVGLRHGFFVERWISDATQFDPARADRESLVARLADYLAFRARNFPAAPGHGASASTLAAMLKSTLANLFGPEESAALDAWDRHAETLDASVRRVATDNRLHAWEWLQLPNGRLVKTDAYDHCQYHDLIGCQDVTWDIAGAAVELGLSADELSELVRRVQHGCGSALSLELLRFLMPCYLAFQCDYWLMAARSLASHPKEVARLQGQLARYRCALQARIPALL